MKNLNRREVLKHIAVGAGFIMLPSGIIVPKAFAKFIMPVQGGGGGSGTLGFGTVLGSNGTSASARMMQITAAASFTGNYGYAYGDTGAGDDYGLVVIAEDNAGSVGSILACTGAVLLPTSPGWWGGALGSAVSIVNGTTYWIGYIPSDSYIYYYEDDASYPTEYDSSSNYPNCTFNAGTSGTSRKINVIIQSDAM